MAVPGGAIFVPGERRRPTEALKPEPACQALAQTGSRKYKAGLGGRDALREEGGKGAAAAAAHTGSRPRTARTLGVRAGKRRRPGPPAGAGNGREGEAAAAAAATREQQPLGECPRGGPAPAGAGTSEAPPGSSQ